MIAHFFVVSIYAAGFGFSRLGVIFDAAAHNAGREFQSLYFVRKGKGHPRPQRRKPPPWRRPMLSNNISYE